MKHRAITNSLRRRLGNFRHTSPHPQSIRYDTTTLEREGGGRKRKGFLSPKRNIPARHPSKKFTGLSDLYPSPWAGSGRPRRRSACATVKGQAGGESAEVSAPNVHFRVSAGSRETEKYTMDSSDGEMSVLSRYFRVVWGTSACLFGGQFVRSLPRARAVLVGIVWE